MPGKSAGVEGNPIWWRNATLMIAKHLEHSFLSLNSRSRARSIHNTKKLRICPWECAIRQGEKKKLLYSFRRQLKSCSLP